MENLLRKSVLVALALHTLLHASMLFAQSTGTLVGSVKDRTTGEALAGATVLLQGVRLGATANAKGDYEIKNIPAGSYKATARLVGYESVTLDVTISDGQSTRLDFQLKEAPRILEEVVVTASKGRNEKKLDAPVTIETVSPEALKITASPSPLGAVAKLKGVDFVERGINTVDITSRGLNTQFNTRMLTLIDGRLATLPGLGLPQFVLAPNPTIDMANIEVVVGPAAALYGPNAHAGVVNMITKDPFNFAGADVSLRGGTQSLYDVNLRYADYDGNFGWKITGQVMDANQFESGNVFIFVAPNLIGQNQTVLNPQTPNALRTTQSNLDNFLSLGNAWRETEVSKMKAGLRKVDGALFYRSDEFNAKFAAGYSQSTGFLGSNFGVLEANNYAIQYQNLQLNGSIGKLGYFLQVTRTANNAGNSFQLHDRAEWLAREATRIRSTGGATLTRDQIVSRINTAFVDSASATTDDSQLYDSELQVRYDFEGFEFVGGAQYRRYLPKAGFLTNGFFRPDSDITATELGAYLQIDKRLLDNKLRLTAAARVDNHTYYSTQFSPKFSVAYEPVQNHNIRVGFNRAFKVPVILENHLFLFGGAARGNVRGYEVRDSPMRNAEGRPTGNIVARYDALRPEQVNTFEIGYKGLFEQRLFIDVVAYYSRYTDFLSPAFQISNGVSTFAFDSNGNLSGFDPRTGGVGIPGQLTTYFNYGAANIAGADIGLTYYFNNDIMLEVSASFMQLSGGENPFEAQGVPLLLNAPTSKYKATLTVRNQLLQGSFASLHGRFIPSYTFRAGRWNGVLNDRAVVDLTLGYEFKELGITVQGSVNNLFDNLTPDVLGSPIMRRFLSASITKSFGSFINR